MNGSTTLLTHTLTANISRAASKSLYSSIATTGLRASYATIRAPSCSSRRNFSSTRRTQLEFFPPPKNTPNIKTTPASWPHPTASEEQLKQIEVAHREPRTFSDWAAYNMVRVLRWGTDLATGYRHDPNKPYVMNERKWLVRFIFLETVAGVPGMVAGMLRHYRSLRRMKRDNGWIETMLEDAYNERMHLLTFMKMAEPGRFMKLMIMGAQGVFGNGFFLAYLLSPKTCHRFVGYLEEEATKTYSYAIEDLESGKLPAWENLEAPDIAVRYWNMPEGKRTMRDLLYYIRADEAKHREIHHTLGNLNQAEDPNPFVSEYKDPSKPHPGKGIDHMKSKGWEREEVV
ncbi:inducible alternative oxidase 2 [Elasticomyces elasticus]|uniref:Alternative oxidase n=1 Tax=Exophiala sideris TaxID=1016849 RepID=A0ABR0IVJ7_9EURO|nr:inducible alternative oxidase 2 [Elasticomyces elasticus]KAK5021180.1 inducible alternative oxidase 2 [Exophiala sideris]KAK5023793.1 inducible alternative oxidase 2 [Exophiala sideris]KAK5048872.1 inducible alternative oxidase 2 [Exophiala sideris]KAK5176338.1 inducible alternative oxidase 2 [Eurotiomycetes sp. CCFEE 6388]